MDEAGRQEVLVKAALAMASELSLPAVLQKISDLACEVAGARYGALGVVGPGGRIIEFVTHGVTEEQRRQIGRLPEGHGILGALIAAWLFPALGIALTLGGGVVGLIIMAFIGAVILLAIVKVIKGLTA